MANALKSRRTKKLPDPKEAAAAVALTGAAAVGGKLAMDKVSASRREEEARAYRLRSDEFVPDGMRRITRGQLDMGIEELAEQPNRQLDEAVHETRKRLKRLRAALRLERSAIGMETYRRENVAFRDMGRKLSAPRDAMVLIETLDELTERFRDELPADSTGPLRARFEQAHKRALTSLRRDEETIGAVRGELEAAHERSASWTFEKAGFDALRPGLERIYRRGRRSMRAAAEERSDEHMHEWRKRSKDFWHALQIVRPADPKRMKKLSKRAHRLSDLLGDDHDLAVLRGEVERAHRSFDHEDSRTALLAVIDRRRLSLQNDAFKLGAKIYDAGPKSFGHSAERGWRKRAATDPQPAAA